MVINLPLSSHHQHEFYTTLSTDISTIAFNRDADHFMQISAGNDRPQGSAWHVTHPSVVFVDRSPEKCGRGMLTGNLQETKAHCGYSVHRAPYPKAVIRLFENSASSHITVPFGAVLKHASPQAVCSACVNFFAILFLMMIQVHCVKIW